jgi:hypothetical protein
MEARKMLSDELIAKIANGIETMPPKPASRREIALLIARVEPQIRAAQERGCTYVEIAKQITQSGYPIKTSTLRLAIQRHRKKEGVPRTRRRKVAPPSPQQQTDASSTLPSGARRARS